MTYKPTIAGILDIVAGGGAFIASFIVMVGILVFGFVANSSSSHMPVNLPNLGIIAIVIIVLLAFVFLAISVLSVVGGVFTLKRRNWGLALAGSIGALFCSPVLGIIAIVFTVLSKNEFEH